MAATGQEGSRGMRATVVDAFVLKSAKFLITIIDTNTREVVDMDRYRLTVLAGLVLLLQGCGGYHRYNAWVRQEVAPPTSPPQIIRGQVASFWVPGKSSEDWSDLYQKTLTAWKQTQLFADVVPTNSQQPSAQGTFILMNCSSSYSNTTRGMEAGVGAMLWVMSAGAMPSEVANETVSCTTEFFQNGQILSKSRSEYGYAVGSNNSWGLKLAGSTANVSSKGNTAAASHIVNRNLVELKKAYP